MTLQVSPAFRLAVIKTFQDTFEKGGGTSSPLIQEAQTNPAQALRTCLGYSEPPKHQNWLQNKFSFIPIESRFFIWAASDFISFASRSVPQDQRPEALSSLWKAEKYWRPDSTLLFGVYQFLQDSLKEAAETWQPEGNNISTSDDFRRPARVSSGESQQFSSLMGFLLPLDNIIWHDGRFIKEISIHDDSQLRKLIWLPESRFIDTLKLSGVNFQTLKIFVEKQHTFFPHLGHLEVQFGTFNYFGIPSIKNRLLSIKEMESFVQILPDSKITSLNLNAGKLTNEDALKLAGALPRSHLKKLYLNNNEIGDKGFAAIGNNLSGSLLEKLYIEHNDIGYRGLQSFIPALNHSTLTHLSLASNKIDNRGVEALALKLPQSSLTYLELAYNSFDSHGAKALAEQLSNSKLIHLGLGCHKINSEVSKIIAQALINSQLTSLDLDLNDIGDEGAKALADTLPRSQLTTLILRKNSITSIGAQALANAIPHSKLNKLDLSINKISSDGIRALTQAQSHSRLTTLKLEEQNRGY